MAAAEEDKEQPAVSVHLCLLTDWPLDAARVQEAEKEEGEEEDVGADIIEAINNEDAPAAPAAASPKGPADSPEAQAEEAGDPAPQMET